MARKVPVDRQTIANRAVPIYSRAIRAETGAGVGGSSAKRWR
jgi:hypothetical protein